MSVKQPVTEPTARLRGPARARPSAGLSGRVRAPGDKSVSHRALILGALAEGVTEIEGLLEGADVLHTAEAMRRLGAEVERLGPGAWRVRGVAGRFRDAPEPLDFGNSGTGCRLSLGAAAGARGGGTFVGDESLSARPMQRVLEPLAAMGARASARDGRLPVRLEPGAPLKGIEWTSPVASAQVKSAILLAGLGAEGRTRVIEPHRTRDHTERMLAAFGVAVETALDPATGAATSAVVGPVRLSAARVVTPADPSSAAFLAAAALVAPRSRVVLEAVMSNPTRTGFFRTLAAMGARAASSGPRDAGGEPIEDWTFETGPLAPATPPAADAASMIDEYPILAVLAAFAEGTSVFDGVEELRVKESDRIAATVAMLRANGVEAEERRDGFLVHGRGLGGVPGGGRVETRHDHRIAMSALVLGLGAQAPVEIDDAAMIETSYPSFFEQLRALGADVGLLAEDGP
jgi:3-phosphoshikimate 1-carboxyvinyltransferase